MNKNIVFGALLLSSLAYVKTSDATRATFFNETNHTVWLWVEWGSGCRDNRFSIHPNESHSVEWKGFLGLGKNCRLNAIRINNAPPAHKGDYKHVISLKKQGIRFMVGPDNRTNVNIMIKTREGAYMSDDGEYGITTS